jgi:RHS repeat-associated protein
MNMSATHSIAPRRVGDRFIPGAGIDERVAQLDATGNVVFIHNDKQHSKFAIALRATLARGVIAISNILGAVIQKRVYGTYGGEADQGEVRGTSTPPNDADQMTLQPNATTIHPFGYTGRRWDADLGLYYYRARWYDPALGTFLETDPIGSLDYINLYSYVGLEPGNGVDPSGMQAGRPPVARASGPSSWIPNTYDLQVQNWNMRGRQIEPRYRGVYFIGNGHATRQDALRAQNIFAQTQARWATNNNITLGVGQPGAQIQYNAYMSNFIVTPGGTAYPIPAGARGPFPNIVPNSGRQSGVIFSGGSGGQNGQVAQLRIMPATQAKGNIPAYPNGYIVYQNNGNGGRPQAVNPYSGKTVPPAFAHYGID